MDRLQVGTKSGAQPLYIFFLRLRGIFKETEFNSIKLPVFALADSLAGLQTHSCP